MITVPQIRSPRVLHPISKGCLYLVGTPIGNLEDITLRAIRILKGVDLIAAEDTRKARILLCHLGITKPTLSCFGANEKQRIPGILARLRKGQSVALISESGMPTISDPGYQLNRACLQAKIPVDVACGPAAPINALLLSGLNPARFRFVGFLPREKKTKRTAILADIARERDTVILFESPRRLINSLSELSPYTKQRQIAIVREMTKRHQQILRGSAAALAESCAQEPPKGEICIVIEGAAAEKPDLTELEGLIRAELDKGKSPRRIADQLCGHLFPRTMIYRLALSLRQ